MFIDNILNIYGERGKVWLDQLPLMIERIASKYHLSELTPLENLSYNYVIKGLQNDKPIILKLSLDINGLKREINALRAFQGYGAVSVLEEEDGMLILERVLPGHSLKSYFLGKDDEAVKIVCDIIKRLHQAPIAVVDYHIPKLPINTFHENLKPYLYKALALEADLLKSPGPSVLLHGDLHHDNIIRNGNSWVVIDPKGYIGDSAYEVAAFIRNPIPDLLQYKNATEMINNRIRLFAEHLDLSEERIAKWCYIGSMQAWIWAVEDNGDARYFEELVQVFDGLLNQSC